MIKKTPHHIDILQAEYLRRKTSNPRYSLRAFAKFLGMSSPTLSRILSGSQEISLTAARKAIKKLQLNEAETQIFARSVSEEKRQRTHKALSSKFDESALATDPHVVFVSDLDHKCIYQNELALKLPGNSLEKHLPHIMEEIGFTPEAITFILDCVSQVIETGNSLRSHIPLETNLGTLAIESLFSPLLGRNGKVAAVASVLCNCDIETLK